MCVIKVCDHKRKARNTIGNFYGLQAGKSLRVITENMQRTNDRVNANALVGAFGH